VQAIPAEINEPMVPAEEKLKIVSVKPSKNTGMDYTPWLNDDLSDLIEKTWKPNNNKWVEVTLQLEHKSKVNKISLYDFEGVFTDKPAEIYAVNGKQNTLLGLFKGESYKEWVDLLLKEPIIADAIMIRKYGNNIPQKINVYGKIISAADEKVVKGAEKKAVTTKTKNISWTAYPNPTAGKIQVEIDTPLEGEVSIDLLDATGHNLQHITVPNNAGNTTQTISLDKYKNGLYFLYLKANGVWEVKKIYKN